MIKSFRDKETEKLFNTGKTRKFNNFKSVALRKLDMSRQLSTLTTFVFRQQTDLKH